jgi:hypothetical protein
MKLVRLEDETAALREWLSLRPEEPVVTSELGRVEVLRAARRVGGQAAQRLAEAARAAGLIVTAPGQPSPEVLV